MNIKEGPDVRTKQDLQNLITSCVLRHNKSRGYNELLFSVCSRLAGSQFENDLDTVMNMTRETMKVLSSVY